MFFYNGVFPFVADARFAIFTSVCEDSSFFTLCNEQEMLTALLIKFDLSQFTATQLFLLGLYN